MKDLFKLRNTSCLFVATFFLCAYGTYPNNSLAQGYSIRGHITDLKTGEPIPFVNVFFNNTTIGTTSNVRGDFYLYQLDSGRYNLIVSMVGYETVSMDIRLSGQPVLTFDLKLKESVTTLSEVQLIGKEDREWNRNLRRFKREFLGGQEEYANSELQNPYVLEFYRGPDSKGFTATANEPLEIINQDLGYKILFFLEKFEQTSGSLVFYGMTRFEELEGGNPVMQEQYAGKRLNTYRGSLRHFFKTLVDSTFREEGFLAYRITGNQAYHKGDTFYDKVGKEYKEIIVGDILYNSRFPYEKILRFQDQIMVIYIHKAWADSPFIDLPYQVTWIRLTGRDLRLHTSGYVYNPIGYEVTGYRSQDRVLQMLPFEYQTE